MEYGEYIKLVPLSVGPVIVKSLVQLPELTRSIVVSGELGYAKILITRVKTCPGPSGSFAWQKSALAKQKSISNGSGSHRINATFQVLGKVITQAWLPNLRYTSPPLTFLQRSRSRHRCDSTFGAVNGAGKVVSRARCGLYLVLHFLTSVS